MQRKAYRIFIYNLDLIPFRVRQEYFAQRSNFAMYMGTFEPRSSFITLFTTLAKERRVQGGIVLFRQTTTWSRVGKRGWVRFLHVESAVGKSVSKQLKSKKRL